MRVRAAAIKHPCTACTGGCSISLSSALARRYETRRRTSLRGRAPLGDVRGVEPFVAQRLPHVHQSSCLCSFLTPCKGHTGAGQHRTDYRRGVRSESLLNSSGDTSVGDPITSNPSSTAPLESLGPSSAMIRRVTLGATVGSIVEWFDVAVYGYLAVVIGQVFFASDDPTISLLSSFAVFAAAFIVRPRGGIFFGSLGDRIGRRKTLAAVILLVSATTFGIGVIPGYASTGLLAPVLLIGLRLLQEFSAGGEMVGASAFAAEFAPAHRRGFLVSLVGMALSPRDYVLTIVPMFHANAWGIPYAALMSGTSLLMTDRFRQPAPLLAMTRRRAT